MPWNRYNSLKDHCFSLRVILFTHWSCLFSARYAVCKLDLRNLVYKRREQYAADVLSKDLLEGIAWDSRPPPTNWRPKGMLVAHMQEHRAAVNRSVSFVHLAMYWLSRFIEISSYKLGLIFQVHVLFSARSICCLAIGLISKKNLSFWMGKNDTGMSTCIWSPLNQVVNRVIHFQQNFGHFCSVIRFYM